MSELTDALLDRIRQRIAKCVDYGTQDADAYWLAAASMGLVDEIDRLRAVVGAQATEPDQDEPAAWDIRLRSGEHVDYISDPDSVAIYTSAGYAAVPLWRHRAREAQAAAPRADEDAVERAEAAAVEVLESVEEETADDSVDAPSNFDLGVRIACAVLAAAAPGAETTATKEETER